MASPEETKKSKAPVHANETMASDKDIQALFAEGFQEITLDRLMYKPESCGTAPLVGYLVDVLSMPPITVGKDERDWTSLLIFTTKPTKGCDREGNVVEVPAGTEIIIPGTHQLLGALLNVARDPVNAHEVFIAPKRKIDIGSGQSMWTFRAGIGKVQKREAMPLLQPRAESFIHKLPSETQAAPAA